ncbi:hypothetical protein ACPV5V_26475, partial [Vibrio campbellii]
FILHRGPKAYLSAQTDKASLAAKTSLIAFGQLLKSGYTSQHQTTIVSNFELHHYCGENSNGNTSMTCYFTGSLLR